jgi:hypothetical protein
MTFLLKFIGFVVIITITFWIIILSIILYAQGR